MTRLISTLLVAAALCVFQSGCCCCRIPFAVRPPVMVNPPPVVVNPPPVEFNPPQFNPPQFNPPQFNPPKDNNNPFKDNAFKPPVQPKQYIYSQSTGQLKEDNQLIGTGYSGKGQAKNNQAMQATKGTGAIPIGEYLITGKQDNDLRINSPVIGLLPVAGKC